MTIAEELVGILGFQIKGEENLKKFKRGMDDAAGSAEKSTRRTQALTRGAAAAVAAGATAVVVATKSAADFEETLFGIKKKSGATTEEMAKIKNEILELGRILPATHEDIAAAYERGAAAGISFDKLREFAILSVKVSDAWDMMPDKVGNSFAGFEKGMGIPLDKMEKFADLINYLADSGISDEKDIVNFLDRVGASAKNFGLAPEETAALGASLVNLKMPAEVAARAMDTLFGKLAAPENLSDKSYSALEKIVGDPKEFKKLLGQDALGGIMEFLGKLEKMSGQERISALGALMGEGFDDEVARLVGGVGELRRNLDLIKNTKAFDGAISALSAERMKMFNSQLKTTKNLLSETTKLLGGLTLPTANTGLTTLNDNMRRDTAIWEGHKKPCRGFMAALLWEAMHSREEKMRLARENGFVATGDSIGTEARTNAQKAYEILGRRPSRVHTPTPRPAPHTWIGSSAREAEAASMRALRSDPNGIADAIDAALSHGADAAARSLADGGRQAGDAATAAMQGQANAIGNAIGTAAAAAISQAGANIASQVRSAANSARSSGPSSTNSAPSQSRVAAEPAF
ncbi:phage tail tape measure protein [Zhengella mangrovi]|uniref:Phage tail tape measure protein n=1 Tax=Zhengella mangrovi TaxID=1982044 RepID=A0A2G1QM28_9HYPH|nr:phage tail tape measure protein [Zhengella mangrovi]PHP66552.1 phage tail tape measure protein [Zhengella mangrovi]